MEVSTNEFLPYISFSKVKQISQFTIFEDILRIFTGSNKLQR